MNKDYKWAMFELVTALKAKATYLKTIDANSPEYNKFFYEGMATAYHLVMEEVKNSLEECDIPLEQFSLNDYNPNEILKYKPLNYQENNEDK